MPHPKLANRLGLAVELLFLTDEDATPVFVPVIQACFSISRDGNVQLLEKQPSLNLAGEWWSDPATSSLKYEPQMAFTKVATDVVLIGHAYAPSVGTRTMQVGVAVGPVRKIVTVVGDRFLVRQ